MSVAKNYGGKAPLDKTTALAFCGGGFCYQNQYVVLAKKLANKI